MAVIIHAAFDLAPLLTYARTEMAVRLPFHRIRIWVFRLTILFLIVTLLPVIALRFLPPIATTLMVERRMESFFREGK